MLKHINKSKLLPRRVVVLGATGFVGSELKCQLQELHIPVIGLGSKELNLLDKNSESRLRALLMPDDVLVFISAIAPCKSLDMLQANIKMVEIVSNVLAITPVAHVIYISSDAVYRDSLELISEDSPAEPNSLHGVMHLTRELALKIVCNSRLLVVRPTLIYGLGDPHNGYGPNQFRRLAFSGKNILLHGKGEELRDHVYVKDVASLICECILRKSVGTINAVSGNVVSFLELAYYISGKCGENVKIEQQERLGPMPHGGYRAFDNAYLKNAFPDIELTSWNTGMDLVITQMQQRKEK